MTALPLSAAEAAAHHDPGIRVNAVDCDDPAILLALARDPDRDVRLCLADRPDLPTDALVQLQLDPDIEVREAVRTSNPDPDDPDELVRLTLRLPRSLHREVEARAREVERPAADVIRAALRSHLATVGY